jgi:hypothetical protein
MGWKLANFRRFSLRLPSRHGFWGVVASKKVRYSQFITDFFRRLDLRRVPELGKRKCRAACNAQCTRATM